MKNRIWVGLMAGVMIFSMVSPIAPALANMGSSTQVKPALVSLTGRINKLVVVGSCYLWRQVFWHTLSSRHQAQTSVAVPNHYKSEKLRP